MRLKKRKGTWVETGKEKASIYVKSKKEQLKQRKNKYHMKSKRKKRPRLTFTSLASQS